MEASTFNPVGVADGDDGLLDVLDVPLFPPPHATTEAVSVTVPRTANNRGPLTQTFRKCIDLS
jgi:hypothetical protein